MWVLAIPVVLFGVGYLTAVAMWGGQWLPGFDAGDSLDNDGEN